MPIEAYFTGLIIGDTLGAACDNLSRAHIKATFKTISNYVDPLPALKKHEDRWKKPASYTAISQFAILAGLLACMRRISIKDLEVTIEKNDSESLAHSIFRHPGRIYASFLENRRELRLQSMVSTLPIRSAHLLPLTASLAVTFPAPEKITIVDVLNFSSAFTSDTITQAGALLYAKLIQYLVQNSGQKPSELFSLTTMIAEEATAQCEQYSSQLFEKGFNPLTLQQNITTYTNLFTQLSREHEDESRRKYIINAVNSQNKSPVSRATIDHPLAILPFALLLIQKHATYPAGILFRSAEAGGSTLPLCSITGSLTGLLFGKENIPENLQQHLINKKKIVSLIETISKKKGSQAIISDFFRSEAPLTRKEKEELQAKLKNIRSHDKLIKKKKTSIHRKKEEELNRHVVESWTKLDKAKWKKEQRKRKQDEDL